MFKDTTVDDLVTILKNTIVLYDKEPILISTIVDTEWVTGIMLSSMKKVKLNLNDPKFDFEPFPLGMVNSDVYCIYTFRKSSRQYRQGLSQDNIGYEMLKEHTGNDLNFIDEVRYLNWHERISKSIKGIYPSVKEAINSLLNKARLQAVSRSFAISREGELFFKSKMVGIIDFDTEKPSFLRNSTHLNWLWERRNESV